MTDSLREQMLRDMESKEIFHQVTSHAFDYADQAPDRQVFPTDDAIRNLDRFKEPLPDITGNASAILEMLHTYGSPATVSQIGGRYFGFVNGGALPAALAARWLADFWDQNPAVYVISPVAAVLESVVESWLRELLGLPDETVAGFVSGSSTAIICGLAAARYRLFHRSGWDVNEKGMNGAPKIRIVAGRQAHSAVPKAIALLGFGTDTIEWVDTDDQGRIIAERVPELDDRTILILQAGNVSTGSFDPFEAICENARHANTWVHIDGAFGLWAAGSKRLNHLTRGIKNANSWSVDGHKTLNTPYDSGIALCNDKDALENAFRASGSYIVYSEHRDGMRYTPEMSRRARAVEIWAALKYLGRAGVDALVFGLHERAVQMAAELAAEGFQILNDVVFNQVLVACDTDTLTEETLRRVQKSGECWAGGAVWEDRPVIRISVCSWATAKEDVSRTVRAFAAARQAAL